MNSQNGAAVNHDSNYVVKVSDNQSNDSIGEILVDTVSLTFSAVHFKSLYDVDDFSKTSEMYLIESLRDYFKTQIGLPFLLDELLLPGRNFFKHQVRFDNDSGFLAFGGNNSVRVNGVETHKVEEKFQLYITGNGCIHLNKGHYEKLMAFIHLTGAEIKRLDIAFDSHNGEYDLDYAMEQYNSDGFQLTGRKPKAMHIDDFGSNDGSTFQVGKRESGKLFRAYEKGKQLGDENSEWVRFEVEIHSKDRVIPPEALLDPVSFFAGAYPCLNFVSQIVQVIRTSREKLKIQFSELVFHARTGYGRLVNFMLKELDYDYEQVVLSLLNQDGIPSRLRWTINV